MNDQDGHICPLCGGRKTPGHTTYSVDLGTGVVMVRAVPATLCDQCGEAWIADEVAKRLEEITAEARSKGAQVEVVGF